MHDFSAAEWFELAEQEEEDVLAAALELDGVELLEFVVSLLGAEGRRFESDRPDQGSDWSREPYYPPYRSTANVATGSLIPRTSARGNGRSEKRGSSPFCTSLVTRMSVL